MESEHQQENQAENQEESQAEQPEKIAWQENPEKLSEIAELYSSAFDLLNDDIAGPEFLASVARLIESDSVMCAWWPVSRPDEHLFELAGPAIELPIDWVGRADDFLAVFKPREPEFLDDMLKQSVGVLDNPADPLFIPGRLFAVVEAYPARIVFVIAKSEPSDEWEKSTRSLLRHVLPTILKSVYSKRSLSSCIDKLDIANKVFDCIPRGIMTIAPDRSILATNIKTKDIFASGSLVSEKDGKLFIADRAIQNELEEQLAIASELPEPQHASFAWYKRVEDRNGSSLLLTVRAIRFDEWRRESSAYAGAFVVTLGDTALRINPGEVRLKEFFKLTAAQARFVNELVRSGSVERSAVTLNISINTARSHLRNVYAKLGVENKSELISLISRTFTGYQHSDER